MDREAVYVRPMAGVLTRAADVGDGRTLVGRLVPYGKPTRISQRLTEEFAPGAFRAQMKDPARIPLAVGHLPHGGQVIGRVSRLWEEKDGLYGEARVSRTAAGNDALELIGDDIYGSWSIGFREGTNQFRDGVTVRKTAYLTELALVMSPAYEDAKVLSVREAGPVDRERVESLLRELALPLPPLDPGA